jgi:hypothetical protein
MTNLTMTVNLCCPACAHFRGWKRYFGLSRRSVRWTPAEPLSRLHRTYRCIAFHDALDCRRTVATLKISPPRRPGIQNIEGFCPIASDGPEGRRTLNFLNPGLEASHLQASVSD